MKKLCSLIVLLLIVGCATTPFENETAAGVRIVITFGDNAVVNDITVTTSSDNEQQNATTSKQDATQETAISVDPSSLIPAGAAAGAAGDLINGVK